MTRSLPLLPLLFTVSATAQVVINEVDYDQPSTDSEEYVEIRNTGTTDFPLQNLSIVFYNGATGVPVEYRTIADPTWPNLAPNDYFVVCASASATAGCDAEVTPATNLIQNGPADAIALVLTENPNPLVLDVVSYGGTLAGAVEGTGTTAEDSNDAPGISIGRFPDGSDTGDNDADFHLMCSTPGVANMIDPLACDLTTGIGTRAEQPSPFTVLLAPGGSHLLVYDANIAAEPLAFDVFAADGSYITGRAASTATRTSWAVPANDINGALLFVRVTTPTRSETRRIVLP